MSDSRFELFPAPAPAPSPISPFRWAGISPESTAALQDVLKENHEKWHIFFNNRGFHNHVSHAVLANWVLGASGPIIRATYKHSAAYQRPAFKSPEPITSQNVFDHLGDENYYNSYLKFFTEELRIKGFSATLEEYIFSAKANFSGNSQPQMLNRFLAGLLHPFIHTGHGAEFGLPGMAAEGLAQTAVHKVEAADLLPPSFFESTSPTCTSLASRLASALVLDGTPAPKPSMSSGVHAFTIIARILKDPKFDVKANPENINYVVENLSDDLRKLVDEWSVDPNEVEKKIEELVITNVLLYAVSGWKKDGKFKANFILMHLVTSSIFLSSLVLYLSPSSQVLFLKSYFIFSLAWYISRPRHSLDIPSFFAADTLRPSQPGPSPTPWEGSLTGSSPESANPNPWLPIIQNSITHPDEHVPKLQRALAHYSAIYGSRVAGEPDIKETELEGADKVDGSLFIRAAGLTDEAMGRVHGGEKAAEFWYLEGRAVGEFLEN